MWQSRMGNYKESTNIFYSSFLSSVCLDHDAPPPHPLLRAPPHLLQALPSLDQGGSLRWLRTKRPGVVEILHSLFLRHSYHVKEQHNRSLCLQMNLVHGARACGIPAARRHRQSTKAWDRSAKVSEIEKVDRNMPMNYENFTKVVTESKVDQSLVHWTSDTKKWESFNLHLGGLGDIFLSPNWKQKTWHVMSHDIINYRYLDFMLSLFFS